jgi:hypothetical protein
MRHFILGLLMALLVVCAMGTNYHNAYVPNGSVTDPTTKFLRADNTWAEASSSTPATVSQTAYLMTTLAISADCDEVHLSLGGPTLTTDIVSWIVHLPATSARIKTTSIKFITPTTPDMIAFATAMESEFLSGWWGWGSTYFQCPLYVIPDGADTGGSGTQASYDLLAADPPAWWVANGSGYPNMWIVSYASGDMYADKSAFDTSRFTVAAFSGGLSDKRIAWCELMATPQVSASGSAWLTQAAGIATALNSGPSTYRHVTKYMAYVLSRDTYPELIVDDDAPDTIAFPYGAHLVTIGSGLPIFAEGYEVTQPRYVNAQEALHRLDMNGDGVTDAWTLDR